MQEEPGLDAEAVSCGVQSGEVLPSPPVTEPVCAVRGQVPRQQQLLLRLGWEGRVQEEQRVHGHLLQEGQYRLLLLSPLASHFQACRKCWRSFKDDSSLPQEEEQEEPDGDLTTVLA